MDICNKWTNGQQYTKTAKDGKFAFWINARTPIEKQSNQDWNSHIHLKNNSPHIKVSLIFWFLIMILYLYFYHQLWAKWICIHIEIVLDTLGKLIHDFWNIYGLLTLNEMNIKLTSLIIFSIKDNLTTFHQYLHPKRKNTVYSKFNNFVYHNRNFHLF